MSNEYPLINYVATKRRTQARCPCGELAEFKVEIQLSWSRGDDDVVLSCQKHKRDVDFLVGALIAEKEIQDE